MLFDIENCFYSKFHCKIGMVVEMLRVFYGTIAVNCPGTLIWMTPAHMHISLPSLFKAGRLPISTVGLPTAQGAVVAGIQGIGVSTPSAAAVAAATMGLAMLEHMPKGMMLTKGALSMMVAGGMLDVSA